MYLKKNNKNHKDHLAKNRGQTQGSPRRLSGAVFNISVCMILVFCSAAGALISGCGHHNSTVYEADAEHRDTFMTETTPEGGSLSIPTQTTGSGGANVPSSSQNGGTSAVVPDSDHASSDGVISVPPFSSNENTTLPDVGIIPTRPGGSVIPTKPGGSVIPTRPSGSVFPTRPGQVVFPTTPENGSTEEYPGQTQAPENVKPSGGSNNGNNNEDKTQAPTASKPTAGGSVVEGSTTSGSGNTSGGNSTSGGGTTSGGSTSGGGQTEPHTEATKPQTTPNPSAPLTSTVQSAPSAGFANIVVFVQVESTASANYYADKTNEINKRWNTDERSLTSFLQKASNGRFTVNNIFPQYDAAKNLYVCYTVPDSCISGQYSSDTALISAVLEQISIDASANVDRTGDGVVDNLTIVVHKDNYTPSSCAEVLWPHKSVYAGNQKINGKYVRNYNIINTSIFTNIINSYGVISHEFMHSLGYPDLYKRTGSAIPVGMWDIMGTTNDYMSYPLAYFRSTISGWANISTVTKTTSGLTLSAQDSVSGTHAYILKNPVMSESEFFVVEYRRLGSSAAGQFTLDSRIPCYYAPTGKNGGIIIYRINTNIDGLSNQGTQNAVYVFRPGVTNELSCGSDLKSSALSLESGRTSFGNSDLNAGIADNAITYSNGVNSGIVVKNVTSASGGTISFDVEFPSGSDGWFEEVSGAANSAAAEVSLVINPSGKISVVNTGNDGTGVYAATANGRTWTKTKPYTGGAINAKTVVWNNKQYIIYMDTRLDLYIASLEAGKLAGAKLIASSVQDYAVTVGSDGVYIAYTDSSFDSKLTVKKYNGTLSVMLNSEAIGNAGTLSIACAGGSVYVAYRAWSSGNAIKVLRVSDRKYIGTTGISGGSLALTADGQTLYLATGTNSADGYMQVYRCTAGSSSFARLGGNISRGSIYQLDIAADGGKIFVLCVNQTTKRTEVYSFNGSDWTLFGSPLEGGTILDSKIVLANGKVIAAYISNGSIYVRSKTY